MQLTPQIDVPAAQPMPPRPEVRSFDSGEECSLDHFLALYHRVQEEFTCADESEFLLAQ